MEDGASDVEAGDVFKGFIEDIAGVEVGDDENVGVTGHGGIGELFLGDSWVDGGVELHFSVEENF